MELIFNADSILERGKGLTFDDVLLIPQHSEISSRKHPVLRSKVTKNWELETPIVAANMDTITEIEWENHGETGWDGNYSPFHGHSNSRATT